MKTLIKSSLAAIIFMMTVLLQAGNVAFAQTVASATTPDIQQGKAEVSLLVDNVKYQRSHISSLQKKHKADCKAGRESAALEDQRQLTRAKGDLKAARAYLKAEKTMFVRSYNLAIRQQRETIRHDKTMLARAEVRLNRNLAALDDRSEKDVQDVIRWRKELANDKAALSQTRENKYNDVMAINKEIRKGEFAPAIYAENAIAYTGNVITE